MNSRKRQLLAAGIILLAICIIRFAQNRSGIRIVSDIVPTKTAQARAVLTQRVLGAVHVASPAQKSPSPKWIKTSSLDVTAATPHRDAKFPWRLRNTDRSLNDLAHSDRAMLLRNALIDTKSGEALPVPTKLRAADEPGFFLVQASHAPDAQFFKLLDAVSARVVTYIPNNAYLVEARRDSMDSLSESPLVAALMPYEPYMKLTPSLIPAAIGKDTTVQQIVVNTTAPETTKADIANMGGKLIAMDQGAFGMLLKAEVPASGISELASSPVIHLVEPLRQRKLSNDRTAYQLGVATSITNRDRFLDLRGSNVLVNINDAGFDTNHPDIFRRIFGIDTNALVDHNGHGTHVAATVLGNGSVSTNLTSIPEGSVAGASFQGEAPLAKAFVQKIDLNFGSDQGDHYLQTTARNYANTNSANGVYNSLISNNSWGYYSAYDYDSASASYDAAVRDALPEMPGEQPIVYVFAAGNDGAGGDNGVGGFGDVVQSPANGKNVIAVGALESARNLTNAIVYDDTGTPVFAGNNAINGAVIDPSKNYQTNAIYAEASDTDTDVASFSARGNTGIGIEGDNGRFKPDFVAPGEFIISARAKLWDLTNVFDPLLQPDLYYLYLSLDDPLQNGTTPGYRYESGTSMSAAAISGFLAMIQEYFEVRQSGSLPVAAYKAILANSARATEATYQPDFSQPMNYSGWGLPNMVNALSGGFVENGKTNVGNYSYGVGTGQSESYTISLADAATNSPLRITLSWTDPAGNPAAAIRLVNNLDLLITNSTGSNVFIGNRFFGTGFTEAVTTNDLAADTESKLFDYVNTTEQVVIEPPLDKSYTITVIGRRVNVNASANALLYNTTPNPAITNIVQDYVLVYSSDASLTNASAMGTITNNAPTPATLGGSTYAPPVNRLTNGLPRFNDRAGANSPLIGGLAGTTNQWHFYVFTNSLDTNAAALTGLTNGSNVAFVTFLPPNLSKPRGATVTNIIYDPFGNVISTQVTSQGEADIDLYVSLDPGLLNLTDDAVLHALKSTGRGGTEYVILTNAPANGEIYYVGVKSEDQQSAEYSFVIISSDLEFSKQGTNGIELRGFPLITPIPDGRSDRPGIGRFMALGLDPHSLRRGIVSQVMNHSNLLDLQNQLRHVSSGIELNNHRPFRDFYSGNFFNAGQITNIVDDSGSKTYLTSQNSDGPGSLNNFIGTPISGPWFLNTFDTAAGQTGRVDRFTMTVQPNLFGLQQVITNTVQPNAIEAEEIDIPADADSLTIKIGILEPAAPLELFVKRNDFPVITNVADNDFHATILPPGATNSITYRSAPLLQAGRYIVAVYNPNSVPVRYTIQGIITHNLPGKYTITLKGGNQSLSDVATTINSLNVVDNRPITDIKVGVRVNDPRVSDLAIHLQSPDGKQALLFENRGQSTSSGLGGETLVTNYQHVAFSFDRLTRLASLYFNGDLVASSVLSTNIPVDTSGNFYFGFDPTGAIVTNQNTIRLDDFGLWRRPLRDDEVRSLFDNGFFNRGKSESMTNSGLVSWWTMDGTGNDSTGTNTMFLSGVTNSVPGEIDNALEFSNEGSYGFVAASDSLNAVPGGGVTLEGWIKAPVTNDSLVIGGWLTATNGFGPAMVIRKGEFGRLSLVFHDRHSNVVTLSSDSGILTSSGITTNVSYATFIDDPNGTPVPIKFATPPYTDKVYQAIVTNTFFEAPTAGVFITNQLADDWKVMTNSVSVVADPLNAAQGNQYLDLQNGVIRKEYFLPLGRRYLMRFAYRTAPGYNGPAEAQVVLNGLGVDHLFGTDKWQTNTITLQNSDSRFELEFQALQPSSAFTNSTPGLAIDNISIEQQADTVGLLPEEAFTDLQGSMSGGQWNLVVTDARGDTNSTPLDVGTLVSWELRLTLAPDTLPMIGLTNGIPYFGATAGAAGDFYYVDVPGEAVLDQVTLVSLDAVPLDLKYSTKGAPDGTDPTDLTIITKNINTNTVVIDSAAGSKPLLPRGSRYYLGVSRSDGGTDPANYMILVHHVMDIIPLTNSVVYHGTNTNPALLDYYSFRVSTNALAVEFSVSNMLADVNLVVSQNPRFPTRVKYDYASMQNGTNSEYIGIDPFSTPVPLAPGTWYLGVYNTGSTTNNVTYDILANELTSTNLHLLGGTTNASTGIVQAGKAIYYYFDVTSVPLQASLDLTGLSGNADLYLSRHLPLPGPAFYNYASTQPSTNAENISWDSFGTPPLEAGRWYAAVVNTTTNAVKYTLSITYDASPGNNYQVLTEDVAITNSAAGPLDQYYKFSLLGDVGAVMFEIFNLTGPADLVASPDVFPSVGSLQFSDIQPGTNSEQVIVLATDIDYLSRDWYLRVTVPAGSNTTYAVRATTDRSGLLISGVPITVTVNETTTNLVLNWGGVPGQFYQLDTTLDLVPPVTWTPVLTNQAASRLIQISLPPPDPAEEQRFYQVEQITAP